MTRSLAPSPGTARDWLRDELARRAYHRSLLDRFSSWLQDRWLDLQSRAAGASAMSTAVVVMLAVLVVLLVLVVASRLRREPPALPAAEPGLGTGRTTPERHRRTAEEALAQGRFDVATVEGFRTVAARATRRGVLQQRPGRTAHELAAELAPIYPEFAADLSTASSRFDAIFYGDRPATDDGARSVLALDDALRAARPATSRPDDPSDDPSDDRADAGTVPR